MAIRSLTSATIDREAAAAELAGLSYVISGSHELEKARVRVTKATRRAIDGVSQSSSGLGEHLSTTVQTGCRCMYQPLEGAPWRIDRPSG